jgi:phage tail-like protein
MSADPLRVYRFESADHWSSGLRTRFEPRSNGTLEAIPRLALRAERLGEGNAASVVAVAPDGTPYWRSEKDGSRRVQWLEDADRPSQAFELSGTLATSPRWVVDRAGIWGFVPQSSQLTRVARGPLDGARTIDVQQALAADGRVEAAALTVTDIASDRCGGVWVLACRRDASDGTVSDVGLHLDAGGGCLHTVTIPGEAGGAEQLAVTGGGRVLAILAGRGKFLQLIDARSGKLERLVPLSSLGPCWTASRVAGDGDNRLALYGRCSTRPAAQSNGRFALYVFDGAGEPLDGPLTELFDGDTSGAPASGFVRDVAIHRDSVWLATALGLRRASSQSPGHARESDSGYLAPLLLSPESDRGRGWLRAELTVDLPAGAAVHAQFAGTDDARLAADLEALIAGRATSSAHARIDEAWRRFDESALHRYSFAGPQTMCTPIAIPLFDVEQRWLAFGFSIVTPPGVPAPVVHRLRVRYPDVSMAEQLPAIFRGKNNDPGGFLRRLVGALESTTQDLDDRIRSIGASLDIGRASPELLDYVADWLGIPWHGGLAEDVKRRLLLCAAELTEKRGTRDGLRALLLALFGKEAVFEIEDVTVDHALARLGGAGCVGGRLPALLAGVRLGTATLGAKAVLGRARLPCRASGDSTDSLDALAALAPTVLIGIACDRTTRSAVEKLLDGLLRQYLPAGLRWVVQWRVRPRLPNARPEDLILDARGPTTLGSDSVIGRAVLGGEAGRLRDGGLGLGFTLK